MQFNASALFAVGAGVGDIFPVFRPGHTVAPFLHFLDKGFLVRASLHGLADVIHQLEFPTLTANGGTILSGGDPCATLFVWLQDRESVRSTELVAELPQVEQGIRMLSQFQARFKTDGVDHKVGMDVFRIAVGSHQHFVPRPGLFCKFQCQFVSLLVRDILLRGEGLHILVKADAILFVPGGLGGFEFRNRVQTVTIHTADPADAGFFIPGFLFLHAVFHDPLHIAGALASLLDIGEGCQLNHPARYGGLPHKWPAVNQ